MSSTAGQAKNPEIPEPNFYFESKQLTGTSREAFLFLGVATFGAVLRTYPHAAVERYTVPSLGTGPYPNVDSISAETTLVGTGPGLPGRPDPDEAP